jgi:hypothetical protein
VLCWLSIDVLSEISRRFSPYAYALDNPVFFIDVDGMYAEGNNIDRDDRPTYKGGHWSDSVRGVGENNNTSNGSADKSKAVEPPVSFFSTNEKSIFTGTFKENNKPKNYTLGDGKFKVFGHGGVDGKGDGWFLDAKLVFGGDGDIGTAKEFDDRMSQVNQAYAKLMTEHKDPKEINLYLCHSGEGNNSMAEKVSKRHPTSTVIGYDGFVMYNGTLSISGISTLEEKNDNKGYRVEFKNGKETSRILYTEYLKLKK